MRRHAEPLTAYQILEELRKKFAKMAPTTVYRTMSALTEKRLVLRLESLSAYMLCQNATEGPASILSICEDCGTVEENDSQEVLDDLSRVLGKNGFSAHRHIIEIHGTCGSCGNEKAQ